mgnify:CR=1 FL=1
MYMWLFKSKILGERVNWVSIFVWKSCSVKSLTYVSNTENIKSTEKKRATDAMAARLSCFFKSSLLMLSSSEIDVRQHSILLNTLVKRDLLTKYSYSNAISVSCTRYTVILR